MPVSVQVVPEETGHDAHDLGMQFICNKYCTSVDENYYPCGTNFRKSI